MIYFLNSLDKKTKEDISIYTSKFNTIDLHVRNMTNYSEYIQKTISKDMKNIITNDINIIDQKLVSYKNLYNIPWKIAILQKDVENNLPHTHNDIIFLPYTFLHLNEYSRQDILLHEKIHLYQRKYPIHTQLLFTTYWLIIPYSLRTYEKPNRSNPDINHIIYSYFSPKQKQYLHTIAQYNPYATKIKDSYVKKFTSENIYFGKNSDIYYSIINNFEIKQIEHPNEVMACLITDIIMKDVQHKITMNWMIKYLNE